MMHLVSSTGTTAGAHRLWSHRSYKATLPLKIILMLFHTSAFQYDIINWARDHRLHHKYSETDADPHNAKRYFCPLKFREKCFDNSILLQWILFRTRWMAPMRTTSGCQIQGKDH